MNSFPFVGEPIFNGHIGSVGRLVFSPDSRLLASQSSRDRTVRLWQVDTGELIRIFPIIRGGLAFAQDGKALFAVDQTGLRSWVIDSGEPGPSQKLGPLATISISRTGKWIAIRSFGGDSPIIRVRELETFRLKHSLKTPAPKVWDGFWALGFSDDERYFLAGDEAGTMILDLETGEKILRKEPMPDTPFSRTHFYTCGERQVTVSVAGECLQFHDIHDGSLVRSLPRKGQPWNGVNGFAVFRGSPWIAINSFYKGVSVFDLDSGQTLAEFPRKLPWIRSIAVSPDGQLLAFASDDGKIEIVKTSDWKRVRMMIGGSIEMATLVIDPTGSFLATIQRNGHTFFWDLKDLQLLGASSEPDSSRVEEGGSFTITRSSSTDFDHAGPAIQLADGTWLATFPSVGALRQVSEKDAVPSDIERARAASRRYQRRRRTTPFGARVLSNNGKWLGLASLKKVILIDVESGIGSAMKSESRFQITEVSISDSGKIAVPQDGGLACVFDFSDKRVLPAIQIVDTSGPVAISPDGKTLAAGDVYGCPILVKRIGKKKKQELHGHAAGTRSLVFTPDGKTLVSCAADGQVILWNTETWERKATLMVYSGKDEPIWIAYTPDGKWNGAPILANEFRRSP